MNIKECINNMSEHDIIMMELWNLIKEADQKTKNISLAEGKVSQMATKKHFGGSCNENR